MLAIVTAFKVWRVYLEGAQQTIIIKTDHKNLTFFTTTKELTRRQARWAEVLSQYDFKIVHCRGTENAQADALSRRPDYEVRGNEISPAILTKEEDGTLRYKRPNLAATLALQPEPLIDRIRQETVQDPIYGIADREANSLERTEDGFVHLHGLLLSWFVIGSSASLHLFTVFVLLIVIVALLYFCSLLYVVDIIIIYYYYSCCY